MGKSTVTRRFVASFLILLMVAATLPTPGFALGTMWASAQTNRSFGNRSFTNRESRINPDNILESEETEGLDEGPNQGRRSRRGLRSENGIGVNPRRNIPPSSGENVGAPNDAAADNATTVDNNESKAGDAGQEINSNPNSPTNDGTEGETPAEGADTQGAEENATPPADESGNSEDKEENAKEESVRYQLKVLPESATLMYTGELLAPTFLVVEIVDEDDASVVASYPNDVGDWAWSGDLNARDAGDAYVAVAQKGDVILTAAWAVEESLFAPMMALSALSTDAELIPLAGQEENVKIFLQNLSINPLFFGTNITNITFLGVNKWAPTEDNMEDDGPAFTFANWHPNGRPLAPINPDIHMHGNKMNYHISATMNDLYNYNGFKFGHANGDLWVFPIENVEYRPQGIGVSYVNDLRILYGEPLPNVDAFHAPILNDVAITENRMVASILASLVPLGLGIKESLIVEWQDSQWQGGVPNSAIEVGAYSDVITMRDKNTYYYRPNPPQGGTLIVQPCPVNNDWKLSGTMVLDGVPYMEYIDLYATAAELGLSGPQKLPFGHTNRDLIKEIHVYRNEGLLPYQTILPNAGLIALAFAEPGQYRIEIVMDNGNYALINKSNTFTLVAPIDVPAPWQNDAFVYGMLSPAYGASSVAVANVLTGHEDNSAFADAIAILPEHKIAWQQGDPSFYTVSVTNAAGGTIGTVGTYTVTVRIENQRYRFDSESSVATVSGDHKTASFTITISPRLLNTKDLTKEEYVYGDDEIPSSYAQLVELSIKEGAGGGSLTISRDYEIIVKRNGVEIDPQVIGALGEYEVFVYAIGPNNEMAPAADVYFTFEIIPRLLGTKDLTQDEYVYGQEGIPTTFDKLVEVFFTRGQGDPARIKDYRITVKLEGIEIDPKDIGELGEYEVFVYAIGPNNEMDSEAKDQFNFKIVPRIIDAENLTKSEYIYGDKEIPDNYEKLVHLSLKKGTGDLDFNVDYQIIVKHDGKVINPGAIGELGEYEVFVYAIGPNNEMDPAADVYFTFEIIPRLLGTKDLTEDEYVYGEQGIPGTYGELAEVFFARGQGNPLWEGDYEIIVKMGDDVIEPQAIGELGTYEVLIYAIGPNNQMAPDAEETFTFKIIPRLLGTEDLTEDEYIYGEDGIPRTYEELVKVSFTRGSGNPQRTKDYQVTVKKDGKVINPKDIGEPGEYTVTVNALGENNQMDPDAEDTFTFVILPRLIDTEDLTLDEYVFGDEDIPSTYEELVDVSFTRGRGALTRDRDYRVIVKKDGVEIDPEDIGEPGEYEVIIEAIGPNNELDPDAEDTFTFTIVPRQIGTEDQTKEEYVYGEEEIPGSYEDLVDVSLTRGRGPLVRDRDYRIIIRRDGVEIDPEDIGEPGEYEVIIEAIGPDNELDPDAEDTFTFVIVPRLLDAKNLTKEIYVIGERGIPGAYERLVSVSLKKGTGDLAIDTDYEIIIKKDGVVINPQDIGPLGVYEVFVYAIGPYNQMDPDAEDAFTFEIVPRLIGTEDLTEETYVYGEEGIPGSYGELVKVSLTRGRGALTKDKDYTIIIQKDGVVIDPQDIGESGVYEVIIEAIGPINQMDPNAEDRFTFVIVPRLIGTEDLTLDEYVFGEEGIPSSYEELVDVSFTRGSGDPVRSTDYQITVKKDGKVINPKDIGGPGEYMVSVNALGTNNQMDPDAEDTFTFVIVPRRIGTEDLTKDVYEYGEERTPSTYEELVDVSLTRGTGPVVRDRDYRIIVRKDGVEIDPEDIGEPGMYEVIIEVIGPNNELDPEAQDRFTFVIALRPITKPHDPKDPADPKDPKDKPDDDEDVLGASDDDDDCDEDHLLHELGRDPDYPLTILPVGPIGKAQAQADLLGSGMLWLTYHEECQAGWTVFEDHNIIAYISDEAGSYKVQKAIDVGPYFETERNFITDTLIVIPGESGEVMKVAVWDVELGMTTQNMLLVDTVAMELVTMLYTKDTTWFDLSLNGLFTSFLCQDVLTTIDIVRAYVARDTKDEAVVAYMLDEHLLEYVSSLRATMLDTTTFAHYTDRFYWGSYPLEQATNEEVLVRITEGSNQGDHFLRADSDGQIVLQERYLLTSKDAKRNFYRWLQRQPRENTGPMLALQFAN